MLLYAKHSETLILASYNFTYITASIAAYSLIEFTDALIEVLDMLLYAKLHKSNFS